MAGLFLGLGTCPICGSVRAKFSCSEKTQLSYITCNSCNFQGFARSDNSDMRLRALVHQPAPAGPGLVLVEPVSEVATEKPAAAPVAVATEKKEQPKPAGFKWGVLSHG